MEKRKYSIEDFTRESLDQAYALERGNIFAMWSPDELRLLGNISPLTVKHINEMTGEQLQYSQQNMIEQAKILACFITNTIDNQVFKGIASPGMVQSKIRPLSRIFEIIGEECPIKSGQVNEGNMLDVIYSVKQTVFGFASRFSQNYPSVTIAKNGTKPFVSDLVTLFGDSLENIILYGSSAYGNGSDYDLILVTRDFGRDMYDKINGKRSLIRSDKKLGIVIMPATHLPSYAAIDDYSYVVSREGRVLYGNPIEFPQMPEADNIIKMYFKIGHDMTSLRGYLMDERIQAVMCTAEEQRRDVFKKEIWIRRGLLQAELGRFISKEDAISMEGYQMPKFPVQITPEIIREQLLSANYRVKERVKLHFERIGSRKIV